MRNMSPCQHARTTTRCHTSFPLAGLMSFLLALQRQPDMFTPGPPCSHWWKTYERERWGTEGGGQCGQREGRDGTGASKYWALIPLILKHLLKARCTAADDPVSKMGIALPLPWIKGAFSYPANQGLQCAAPALCTSQKATRQGLISSWSYQWGAKHFWVCHSGVCGHNCLNWCAWAWLHMLEEKK